MIVHPVIVIGTVAQVAGAQAAAVEAKRRQDLGLPPVEHKPYVPTWKDTAAEWGIVLMVALPGVLFASALCLLAWKIVGVVAAQHGVNLEAP